MGFEADAEFYKKLYQKLYVEHAEQKLQICDELKAAAIPFNTPVGDVMFVRLDQAIEIVNKERRNNNI